MGLYTGGLIIGRILASEIWGAYFREGLLMAGLIIGILRCLLTRNMRMNHKDIVYIFFFSSLEGLTKVLSCELL